MSTTIDRYFVNLFQSQVNENITTNIPTKQTEDTMNRMPPPRMYTSEVLELARFSQGTLNKRIKDGEFPKAIDRGKENIFDGYEVYKALGLIKEELPAHNDPWLKAAQDMEQNNA